ncbi:MAG: RNA 2',3'-cyclic phosphodiesterase [Syntrophales bacterium]
MTEEKTTRSFLAVELPGEILIKITDIQKLLKKTIQGIISWGRPEGIHLTLKFFGNISGDDVANLSRVVERSLANVKPLSLNVRTIGVFPSIMRPRIIWLGINGDVAPLIKLQETMDYGFQDCGFKKEARSFRPHLTMGRIKSPKGLTGLAKVVEEKENYVAGQFQADGLTLLKSDLTPKGAIYTKLAWFPFQGV